MNKKLQKIYKNARNERDPWMRRWDECAKFSAPETYDDAAILYDATAADAVDMLAANMFSLLTPPESLWLSLERTTEFSPDPVVAENALRAHLNDSNFYTTIHQCYLDLCVLGTACLLFSETPLLSQSAFRFSAVPMRDIAIVRDNAGNAEHIFHTSAIAADEIAERYPDWTPPAALRDKITANPDTVLPLVQCVSETSDSTWDFCAWIDCGGEFENNIVATGKFETCPYLIFRWSAASGEAYGRSPVMRALPDIKTANKVVELVLKNATIAVSGIWQADDDGVINLSNINLTPGAIIPKAVGSSGLTPLKSGADFDVSQLILSDLRARIRHALLADRLSVLTDKTMTATEIIARNTDMMRILGATYGRLLSELIKPLAARGLCILARRGIIDPIILHRDADLKYLAPISQLAADERVTQILSWLSAAGNAGMAESINAPAVMDYLAGALHIPAELINE
ncbi:MAG: head-tail connector protein [Rickettsiales bacterium]|jgi:hypothetical protein|nr:head-tail connector protein [Rickettsiales bacterium]